MQAQSDGDVPSLRHNIKGDFMLPTPVGNRAFTKTVDGIADVHLSWQYPFLKDFFIGAGLNYVYMQINDFVINDAINANTQMYIPHLIAGYEKFANDIFSYGISVRAGYSFMSFSSNSCSSSNGNFTPEQKGYSLEPAGFLAMSSGENLTFGLIASYHMVFAEYNSSLVCLKSFSGLTPAESEGIYQFISVGFGFTAFMGEEKKRKRRYHNY